MYVLRISKYISVAFIGLRLVLQFQCPKIKKKLVLLLAFSQEQSAYLNISLV